MRVSIVTISFNQARYLAAALQSVLEQDYDDVEYIVVDPGSTDGSTEILEHYRPRLAALLTQPDDGPADGLNRGFAHATGDVFAYLNADDVLLPGAVGRAVRYLESHPDVDVVYGDGVIVDGDGLPLRRFRSSPYELRRWVRGGVTAMQQATFFRSEAFEAVGGFNADNRAIWDAELLLDFALGGHSIRNVHEDWALFRIHGESISGSKRNSDEVAGRIRREQDRLFDAVLRGADPPRAVERVLARAAKWSRDPVGLAYRLGEAAGVRPRLDETAAALARPSDVALRVDVLSHAYIDPAVRKNIAALAEHLDVRVLSPSRWEVLVFDGVDFADHDGQQELFATYKPVRLFGAQYLLPSLTMGFRRRVPDVIHIEYDPWSVVFWQALLCRRLFARHARVVCHVKKNTYRRYTGIRGLLKYALARAGVRRVDRFLAASEMAAELYEHVLGAERSRIDVVPHLAVDLGAFPPARVSAGQEIAVGYVGLLAEHKGVFDLVDAISCARKQFDLQLHLLGRGQLEPVLRAKSQECDWLHLHAAVPNALVPAFLADLDVFVMPSRVLPDHEEHDALALVEALAAGLPAIGTRSGIIPEILGDGTGVLVAPGDPAELAAAIEQLAGDIARRTELGARARAKVQLEFDLPAVAARKAKILKEVAA